MRDRKISELPVVAATHKDVIAALRECDNVAVQIGIEIKVLPKRVVLECIKDKYAIVQN